MTGGGIDLHVGIVFASVPYTNSYFVKLPAFGRVTATSGEEGSGDRRGSTGGGMTYLPGTRVLVASPEKGLEESLGIVMPYTIICGFAQLPKVIETEHTPQWFTENLSDFNNNPAYDIITDADYEKTLRQDRSFNRLLDALPGDWTKTNALGSIIDVSMFLARIGTGPDCILTFHGIDRTAEMTADNFIRSSHSFLEYVYSEGRYSLHVEQLAATPFEGLGGISGPAMEEAEEGEAPTLVEETQRSLMRQSSLKGGAVEGELSYTQVPTGTGGLEVHAFYDGKSRAGLTRIQNRTDGIIRLEAAKEIGLYKTGSIQVPQQTADVGTLYPEDTEETEDEYDGQTDVEAKMEELGIDSEEEYYAVKSLIGEDIKTFEEDKYFWRGLRQEGGIWVIPTKGDGSDTEIAPAGENPQLQSIADTEPEYGFDTLSSIMTEAIEVTPGRKVKLFKNNSMFLMSEEGNITIGDGKGASIKFENGNLILGSALDVKIQPGRNLVTVVPGNEIKKVGKSYELAANGSGISIKSEGNLHMLSGNGGQGSTLLENRAASNDIKSTSEKKLKAGDPRGGGIFLKSEAAGVNVAANAFTVAGHPSLKSTSITNAKGYDRQAASCLISLDAGRADLSLLGSTGSMLFSSSAVLGELNSSTGMYISGGVATLIADSRMSVHTPSVQIAPAKGTVKRPVLSSGGIRRTKTLPIPTSDNIRVQVSGSVTATGVLESKKGIQTEGGVTSNKGANSSALPRQLQIAVEIASIEDNRAVRGRHEGSLDALLTSIVEEGLASDKSHSYSAFCFPESESPIYNVDPEKSYFTQLPWQKMLQDSGGTWKENFVPSAILGESYPYPGTDAFEDSSKVYRKTEEGDVQETKFEDYVTNVK
jgi:hypothetical protein